jgi:hypothetical protein
MASRTKSVLKMVNPFAFARWVYGDYQLFKVLKFQTDMLPKGVQPDNGSLVDQALERVLTTRALIALGLLALVVRIVLDPVDGFGHLGDMWDDIMTDGFLVLYIAPYAVLVLFPLLVLAARPEHRRATARAFAAPVVTAVFTQVFLVVMVPQQEWFAVDATRAVVRFVTFDSLPMPLTTSAFSGDATVGTVLFAFFSVWLGLVALAAAYLGHRNGLCRDHTRLPVLAPVVAVVVVWTSLILKFAWAFPGWAGLDGWKLIVTAYCTPVAATIAAAYELRQLAKKKGVTFRAPVPARPAVQAPLQP